MLGRDLLDRPVASQCFQRHPGLEVGRKPASCRHLVSLRYPVEYTLTDCPISRDHLTLMMSSALAIRVKGCPKIGVPGV